MRLLDTTSLKLHEFVGSNIPPYAILSHTWQDDEVSFSQWTNSTLSRSTGEVISKKAGYQKIVKFCRTARKLGFSFGWVDTCCIDKSSSAELSEAINSMYKWYERAEICFAYLVDVPSLSEVGKYADLTNQITYFTSGRWFRRGWTLQELLAPREVLFLDKDWDTFGTRTQLHSAISQVTGIDPQVLTANRFVTKVSAAHRMSWAANRTTTREEDMAYSLMGLFDVSMPLLYGEGGRHAFNRLQMAIFEQNPDESLFAWGNGENHGSSLLFVDKQKILAPSPDDFAAYKGESTALQIGAVSPLFPIGGVPSQRLFPVGSHGRTEISLTNMGMKIHALLAQPKYTHLDGKYLLPLDFMFVQNRMFWCYCLSLRKARDKVPMQERMRLNSQGTSQLNNIGRVHGLKALLRGLSDAEYYVKDGIMPLVMHSEDDLLSMTLTQKYIEILNEDP